MNVVVTVLALTLGAAWVWVGYAYARIPWDQGAPNSESWARARALLIGIAAASLVLVALKLFGSVQMDALDTVVMGVGSAVGACGFIIGQLRRRRQVRSTWIHDDALRRASRHPLGVVSEVFYTIAVAAGGVSAGLVVIGLQWNSDAAIAAGSLTAIPALIFGFHSHSLRRRAIEASVSDHDEPTWAH